MLTVHSLIDDLSGLQATLKALNHAETTYKAASLQTRLADIATSSPLAHMLRKQTDELLVKHAKSQEEYFR